MNSKRTFSNIISVALSNCFTIFSGIIVGFIIPRILTVESFGYYKTFTLYVTYLGLFSLGIIDGIVLRYGGKDYDELDRPLFRGYFKWYTLINTIFSILFIYIGIIYFDDDLRFILLMLGLDLLAVNISGYYQQVSQITMRFKEYSWRRILQSLGNILAVCILFGMYCFKKNASYELYVILLVFINILLSLWYIWTYRDISFGKSRNIRELRPDIAALIKSGFPLLVANLCSTLIITLDRQFVNILFDTETYAIYAFAYSMLALVTVAISAISTVLYPTLKRTTIDILVKQYKSYIAIIQIIVFACILAYFPLCMFIRWFLPNYESSLSIFRVIFPGLAINSTITIVMQNYYKAFGESVEYFKKSVMVLAVSFIANVVAYSISRTALSISVASIFVMIIWYLCVDQYFVKKFSYNRKRNFGYMLCMLCGFYLTTCINNDILSMIVYILCYVVITLIYHGNMLRKLKKKG